MAWMKSAGGSCTGGSSPRRSRPPAGPNSAGSLTSRATPWPWTATTSSSPWSALYENSPWWRRTTAGCGTWARFPGPSGSSPATDRVLTLLADYLADQAAGPVEVFYDAPLSLSGELARRTREIFASRGLTVRAAAVPVPERRLSGFPGAIATSDTALIDAHATVVDLAGEIIRRHREWPLIDLGESGNNRED